MNYSLNKLLINFAVVSGTGPTTKNPEKNCSSVSTANKTHAKSKSKSPTKRFKQPKNLVEIPSNQPGGTLEHQWPEIESVYLATETMIEQLNENPIALISEKLDGSNLSVSSSGMTQTTLSRVVFSLTRYDYNGA